MRSTVLLLAAFCAIAGPLPCLQAEATGKLLRVATYNVRNYLCMDRMLEGQFRVDYPKPEAEKDVVRRSIHQVSPDILALQEIGSEAMLLELRRDLAREGLNYEGYALLEAADETRRVAALWREGLTVEVVEHTDLDFPLFDERLRVKRGMLQLNVVENGSAGFSAFVLHLKSKYTNDQRDPKSVERRTREAQAARDRILDIFPDPSAARFIILGDLNDGPNSRALSRFRARGSLKIAEPFDCRDPHGLIWTHFYKKGGEYAQIDYILLSPAWRIEGSLQGSILGDPDYYDGSDHRLVWADLSF